MDIYRTLADERPKDYPASHELIQQYLDNATVERERDPDQYVHELDQLCKTAAELIVRERDIRPAPTQAETDAAEAASAQPLPGPHVESDEDQPTG